QPHTSCCRCSGQQVALFPRSDRQETRVRLQCYFLRTQCLAETKQIDPTSRTSQAFLNNPDAKSARIVQKRGGAVPGHSQTISTTTSAGLLVDWGSSSSPCRHLTIYRSRCTWCRQLERLASGWACKRQDREKERPHTARPCRAPRALSPGPRAHWCPRSECRPPQPSFRRFSRSIPEPSLCRRTLRRLSLRQRRRRADLAPSSASLQTPQAPP